MQYAVAFLTGVSSHFLFFSRGEHHLYGSRYLQALLAFFLIITVVLLQSQHGKRAEGWRIASIESSKLILFYLLGVYSSLTIYRLLLHPLNRFPGPIGARLSSLWLSWRVRRGDGYKQVAALHSQYGPFVRVGSSDLAVMHPEAVNALYGGSSECTKASNYDVLKPIVSLQTMREKAPHTVRRRIWSSAFGERALRGYEERIRIYQEKLVSQLAALKGRPTNLTHWFSLYSFDVMGDLAFAKPFDMLDTTQNHWAVQLLEDGIKPLSWMLPIWTFRLAISVPVLSKNWWKFLNFAKESLESRMKSTPSTPDLMAALLAPLQGRNLTEDEFKLLLGDAQLIIAAGSDTTATTLTAIFYLLVKNPDQIQKLRREVEPFMTDRSGVFSNEKIAHLPHLNGVINEALRLYPAVPTAITRTTPPQGISIDGTYIPGGMNVWSSQYALGRSESIYTKADQFIPERWYELPDMVKNKSAFAPFSIGSYNCIGKPLALLNLRTIIARLICAFDITLAPGDDGSSVEDGSIDHFMLTLGDLMVSLKSRSMEN